MYTRIHRRFDAGRALHNALFQFVWQTTQIEAWALEY
jgi:hypothetical protein